MKTWSTEWVQLIQLIVIFSLEEKQLISLSKIKCFIKDIVLKIIIIIVVVMK